LEDRSQDRPQVAPRRCQPRHIKADDLLHVEGELAPRHRVLDTLTFSHKWSRRVRVIRRSGARTRADPLAADSGSVSAPVAIPCVTRRSSGLYRIDRLMLLYPWK
jgi:hypothetical protein